MTNVRAAMIRVYQKAQKKKRTLCLFTKLVFSVS